MSFLLGLVLIPFVVVDPRVRSTLSVDELRGVRQAIVVDLVDGCGLELAVVVMEVVGLFIGLLVIIIGCSLSLGSC